MIAEIRRRLKDGLPCRVVSTQLLEAGVDLDFPVGYRALAGLESIIQSAGRVNREGKLPIADLFVFEPDSDSARRAPAYIRQAADVARQILEKFLDPVCIAAIQAYYREVYNLQDPKAFDSQDILGCFEKGTADPAFDFKTAAEHFKLIEDNTVAVIIPWNAEARELIKKLAFTEFPLSIIRKLQPYVVNIYEPEYNALLNAGAVDVYCERFSVLNDLERYDQYMGLAIPENTGGQGIFI